jgi:hypothetical protein
MAKCDRIVREAARSVCELPTTSPDVSETVIAQGRALVRAIEALGTIEPSGPFEHILAPGGLDGWQRYCTGDNSVQ